MTYTYEKDNIFAKILRGEIPNNTVLESDHTLAFEDINPLAPNHVLVIPKGPYVNYAHFAKAASDAEIIDFNRMISKVVDLVDAGNEGYRLISNAGRNGVQDVPHLHVHILAGRPLGPMLFNG